MQRQIRPVLVLGLIVLLIEFVGGRGAIQPTVVSADGLWRDVDERSFVVQGPRLIIPHAYRTVALDMPMLTSRLASVPLERSPAARAAPSLITLPLPDGSFGRFQIEEAPVMAPGLAAKFPLIKTYLGQGIDDPSAIVRMDNTPAGFHAMILAPSGTVFIDPYSRGDTIHYMSYWKGDYVMRKRDIQYPPLPAHDESEELPSVVAKPSGTQLRTYRLAVAATGEYTQFHGGTVDSAMAAIATTINRVVGVYEREVAIRMVLVENNEAVVFTDPILDPYVNEVGLVMLFQNQDEMDERIGDENYDIGHVFSTGGGGVAQLGVPCQSGSKAMGVTGRGKPVGDPFDIDYVAHEMGHQFGANHTFNGTTSSCGGGNRNQETAFEPGSGSTIMAYAGICAAENLQPNSDDYFHTASFDEIVAYTTTGEGNTCPTITPTNNNPPVVDAGETRIIPARTPFTLTGSATDPDGDPLTYHWEQLDAGAAAPPNTDNGNRAIFRSFDPTNAPSRTFPRLSDILANTTTFGESLPTTNRDLDFRLTARDNRAGGGGVDYDTVRITVTNTAGPFVVTAPITDTQWTVGDPRSVTWDVANTAAAPVNCATVNIRLSTDGGQNFTTTLAENTPNDGSELVMVPGPQTNTARVRVECATNIFFDISNGDFSIVDPTSGTTPTVIPPTLTPTISPTQEEEPTRLPPIDPTSTATTVPATATSSTEATRMPTTEATGTATQTATRQAATSTATTIRPEASPLYLPFVVK